MLPQLIQFCAALLLLLSFGMLAQRRMLNLIRLLALQGLVLSIDVALVAYTTDQPELYLTVALTLLLKVLLIPFAFQRILTHLGMRTKVETIFKLPSLLLIGLALVIFAFNLGVSISHLFPQTSGNTLSLALASVLISNFMMVIKRKAISQVIGLLALENNLFFVGTSFALGIAFDALIGLLIFGVFFLRIRDTFDSFDLHHLEKLREE